MVNIFRLFSKYTDFSLHDPKMISPAPIAKQKFRVKSIMSLVFC